MDSADERGAATRLLNVRFSTAAVGRPAKAGASSGRQSVRRETGKE